MKHILALLSILGMVSASFGQSIIDGPQSIYLNGISINTGFGTFDFSEVEFVRSSQYDNGPGNRGVYYTSAGTPIFTVQISQGTATGNPPYSIMISGHDPSVPNWAASFMGSWGGDSYDAMTNYSSRGIVGNPPATFGGANFVNGLNASGLPVGGAPAASSGSEPASFSCPAPESLLSGLTYENGQWTPAQ